MQVGRAGAYSRVQRSRPEAACHFLAPRLPCCANWMPSYSPMPSLLCSATNYNASTSLNSLATLGHPTALAARPLQIAPTEDEQRALQRYRGPREELSPPEQFLLTMCAVPRLDRKVCMGAGVGRRLAGGTAAMKMGLCVPPQCASCNVAWFGGRAHSSNSRCAMPRCFAPEASRTGVQPHLLLTAAPYSLLPLLTLLCRLPRSCSASSFLRSAATRRRAWRRCSRRASRSGKARGCRRWAACVSQICNSQHF